MNEYPYSLPGKISKEIIVRQKESVGNANNIGLYGLVFDQSKGTILTDVDGNKFIDFFGGASVINLGYNHEQLTNTFVDAIKKLQHTCAPYTPNVYQIQLSESLIKLHPGKYNKKVLLGLCGSDSIDGAIKAAIKYTHKNKVISFRGSYHGSTGISFNATGFAEKAELVPGKSSFIHLDYPKTKEMEENVITELSKLIIEYSVATILIEPILGDGGVFSPSNDFFIRLQEMCQKSNIVLIVDEIQSGMGRTGKFWSFEHTNLVPDIIVTGKGLSNGYAAISAIIGKEEIINSLKKGEHIFTYTGHPASCAVSNENVKLIQEKLTEVEEKGSFFITELNQLAKEFPQLIINVRGKGFMIGVELRNENNKPIAGIIGKRCLEYGAYFGFIGKENEVLRIQPPYVITKEQITIAIEILRTTLKEYVNDKIPVSTCESYEKYSLGLGN